MHRPWARLNEKNSSGSSCQVCEIPGDNGWIRTGGKQSGMGNQRDLWDRVYAEDHSFFGQEPSLPARRLLDLLENRPGLKVLELGGGQGRDTLFLASKGLHVTMVECSETGLAQIKSNARNLGIDDRVSLVYDHLEKRIPFPAGHFDACFSHMFLCMPFSRKHLSTLFSEISRILKPGGIHVFSVRNTHDAHYGKGTHKADQVFEIDGFPVRFFDEGMIREFSRDLQIEKISEFQEGELPRTLYFVAAKKR